MEEQQDKLDFDLKELERLENYASVKRQNRRFLFIILGLTLANIVSNTIGLLNSDSDYEIGYRIGEGVAAYLLMLPLLSFILGIIPSLFPNRKLPFGKRYPNTSLWLLIVLNVLALIGNILDFTSIY